MKALVVDGYNVIHKIRDLEALLDIGLREARHAVTRLAVDYQHRIGGINEVRVVFDGRDEYRNLDIHAPAHQVFSKSDEGDKAIIKTVERLSSRYHVLVVSDDNFVRNNSRAHNASIISVSEFEAVMKKNNTKNNRRRSSE